MHDLPTDLRNAHPRTVEDWIAWSPRRWQVWLLASVLVAIYLGGVTNRWWPTPDGALYLGLANSLAQGHGYTFNFKVSTFVTPGLPLILAGLRIVFGESFAVGNLFETLCTFCALLLVYRLLARLDSPAGAFAVTLAAGSSFIFLLNGHRILTDMPFTAVFWGMLYCAFRCRAKWPWLAGVGILSALGIFIRLPGLLALAPAAVAVVLQRSACESWKKRLPLALSVLVPGLLVAGGFFFWTQQVQDRLPEYARFLVKRANYPLEQLATSTLAGVRDFPATIADAVIGQSGWQIGMIFLILAGAGTISLWKRNQKWVAPLVALYPFMLLLVDGDGGVRTRYWLPIQPLIVYAILEGFCRSVQMLHGWRKAILRPTFLRKATWALLGVLVMTNLLRVVDKTIENIFARPQPGAAKMFLPAKYAELSSFADTLRESTPADTQVALLGKEERILHFLSQRRINLLPTTRLIGEEAARSAAGWAQRHREMGWVACDSEGIDARFTACLLDLLDKDNGLRLIHRGKQFSVYQRIGSGMPALTTTPWGGP